MKVTRLLSIGLLFVVLAITLCSCMEYKNQSSDKNRGYGCEKYTGEVDKNHGFWEDHSNGEPWIDTSNCRYLEEGFESFYKRTGVWPFLYVTDNYGGNGDFSTYEEAVYDQLFGKCPGNLLFVFIGNEESYYIAAGTGTNDVVNNLTVPNVIQSKISKYWNDSSVDGDLARIFGKALESAGSQLIKESTIGWWDHCCSVTIILLIVFSLVLLGIVVASVKSLLRKNDYAENKAFSVINGNDTDTGFFCYRCGSRIITEGKFCPNCGEKLKGSNPNKNTKITKRLVLVSLVWVLIWVGCILPFYGISDSDLREGTEEFGIFSEAVVDTVVDTFTDYTGINVQKSYSFIDMAKEVDAAGLIAVMIIFPLGGMICLYRPNRIKSILCVIFSLQPALFLYVGYWGRCSLADRMQWMKYGSYRIGAFLLLAVLIVLPIISIIQLVRQTRLDKRIEEMNI